MTYSMTLDVVLKIQDFLFDSFFPGPCFGFECNRTAAECVVNNSSQPECECITCRHVGLDPVCGFIVYDEYSRIERETWKSECHLRQFACENEVHDFEVMAPGACGG